jgi:hypothetical protein
MKRPSGITAIALLLGWLSIAGFGNTFVLFNDMIPDIPAYFGVFSLLYGITALASCVGLWKMKSWSVLMLRGWMLLCLIFILSFSLVFIDYLLGGYVGMLLSLLFIFTLFWFLNSYVGSKFKVIT